VVILAPPGGDFRPTPRLEVGPLVVSPAARSGFRAVAAVAVAYALAGRDAE
jgi:hypothetical protein